MAVAGPFIDEVLRRTRDPQGGGTSRAQVRLLLSYAQRTLNTITAAVLVERPFTLEPHRVLYDLDEIVQVFGEPFVRVQGVRFAEANLLQEDWRNIARCDRTWLRRFAPQPFAWASIGGNLFVIYPGAIAERIQVTLVLVPLLPLMDSEASVIALPVELHSRLVDLTEGLVFMRRRLPAFAAQALERAAIIPREVKAQRPQRPVRIQVVSSDDLAPEAGNAES